MSQSDVYNILLELGGTATVREIAQRAREKYPRRTLHLYVNVRLRQLQKWGMVRRDVILRPSARVSDRRRTNQSAEMVRTSVWVATLPPTREKKLPGRSPLP